MTTGKKPKRLAVRVVPCHDDSYYMCLQFEFGGSSLGDLRLGPEDFAEFIEGIRAGFPDAKMTMKGEDADG